MYQINSDNGNLRKHTADRIVLCCTMVQTRSWQYLPDPFTSMTANESTNFKGRPGKEGEHALEAMNEIRGHLENLGWKNICHQVENFSYGRGGYYSQGVVWMSEFVRPEGKFEYYV